MQILNEVQVGSRVWSMGGYPDHGPNEGPKVSIPADTGGVIVGADKQYPSMGQLLYVVQWDTGQTSKHYFKQLCVIGQFATFADFQRVIETGVGNADVVLGPQGGFRQASVDLVLEDGSEVRLKWHKDQGRVWDYFKPLLLNMAIVINETKLESRKPEGRARD